MKIWHLLSNRWNSAITEYALSAARALELVGHRSLFTPLAGSPAASRSQGLMLQTKPVKSFSVTEAGILRQIAGDFNPDAIITYGGPETFLSRWLGLSTSCKVLRFRGQELPPTRYFFDLKQRFALRSIDVTLTPSKAMAQEMRGRRLHSHIESVLLGCDTERFHRVSPGEPPRSQGRPELVIFGRFDPVKGHREFMQIFADLLDQCPVTIPRPFLHIVGQAANLSGTDLLHAAAACGLRQTD